MLSYALRSTAAEAAGVQIGLYTLEEKLGDGGFGSVWRAVQSEPVEREVALKIVKIGMDTLEVMSRFEQERMALAMMDHPNIARVLDAGATPEGRPFFVMELVRGVPITTCVIERKLTLGQRLALFKDVCAGVQHAHQKGVIHRDLKPSNILVAEIDGALVPKIIDFGIAKATSSESPVDQMLRTRAEQMIGTPLYMSPEQVRGSADIDTRSDVYALGVVLYELLAGRPPFDAQTLTHASHDEMRRMITEIDPRPPSQTAAPDGPLLLNRRKSKDLDLVVLKAMAKDRSRRYESATAFAEDVQRFLSHEPVSAHAPSLLYVTGRWARKHRMAALAAAAVLVGASVAVWQALRATRAQRMAEASAVAAGLARTEAERQLRDAETLTEFIVDALVSIRPYGTKPTIDRADLQRQLLEQVRSFQGEPLRKAKLLVELSRSVSGEEHVAVLLEALNLSEPLLEPDDQRLWKLRFNLASARATVGDPSGRAVEELRRIYQWYREHLGAVHNQTVYVGFSLGKHLYEGGKYDEASEVLGENCRIAQGHPEVVRAGERVFFQAYHASSLWLAGRADEGLQAGRENLRAARSELGPDDYEAARAFSMHAELCRRAGLRDEAIDAARQALDRLFVSVGPLDIITVDTLELLSALLSDKKDTEALIEMRRNVLQVHDQALGPVHEATAEWVKKLAVSLAEDGRATEADELCQKWLKRVRHSNGALPASCEEMLRGYKDVLSALPDWPRAEAALKELISLPDRKSPEDLQRWTDQSDLAEVLIKQKRAAEALPLLNRAIKALEERVPGEERDRCLALARKRLGEAKL